MPRGTDAQKEVAMRDAETRLSTGGGLFGEGGLDLDIGGSSKKNST